MTDQKNTILAIVLSALVLIGWQIYFGIPQMEKQKQIQQQQAQERSQQPPGAPAQQPGTTPQTGAPAQAVPGATPQAPGLPGSAPGQIMTREAALAASPRVRIETPNVAGSIALKGARIDDLALIKYRETVDPKSPPIVLLAPSGSPHPFYSEFGWVVAAGTAAKAPTADTLWRQEGSGALTVEHPVTLVYDNGEGLEFRRTITVDNKYLFTLKDEVVNKGAAPVTLYPYALISRHGIPPTLGYYILHEGLIGVFGDKGLQEETYAKMEEKKSENFDVVNAWLGFTDKYWAATLLPDIAAKVRARFSFELSNNIKKFQTDYLLDPQTIAPGATGTASARLFAGAKEVEVIDNYDTELKLNRFELLIDWGYFRFITKPMFLALDWIYRQVGNFGVAILIITVLIKIVFFPLANKSYASMAKMKAVQPEMMAIRERYGDDKMKQQQAMMELYKKEKINPIAGCLPIAHPDSGLLRALQGAVHHHRNAARAVLRLDQGSLGARPAHGVQPVRAHPVGSDRGSADRPVPPSRSVAAHHGRDHVVPDEAQSAAAGSDPEDDLRLYADHLHLHAGELLRRTGDLLGLEQHALGAAAEHDHAQARRQDRAVGQSQAGGGRPAEFFQEPFQKKKVTPA